MHPPRLALAVVAAAFALSGCAQVSEANDNTNPQQDSRTVTPPTVLRTPVRVPEAPPTVDTRDSETEPQADTG